MFDISWSELLILGVVTLIFVGPKELPVFLRTIGRYVGMIKRQAGEFREQFDTAMREAELEQIRKDMMTVKTDVESSVRTASRSVEQEFETARREFDAATRDAAPQPNADLPPAAPDSAPGPSPAPMDAGPTGPAASGPPAYEPLAPSSPAVLPAKTGT